MADANHTTPDNQSAENGGTLTADMIAALREALADGTVRVSGFMMRNDSPPIPKEVPEMITSILKGDAYPPRIKNWRNRKIWTAEQAAWLSVNIDPYFTAPRWYLRFDIEGRVRGVIQIIIDEFLNQVGENQPPLKYIEAMKECGICPPWLNDDPAMHATVSPQTTPAPYPPEDAGAVASGPQSAAAPPSRPHKSNRGSDRDHNIQAAAETLYRN